MGVEVPTPTNPEARILARSVAFVRMTKATESVVPMYVVGGLDPELPTIDQLLVEGIAIVPHVGGEPVPADFKVKPALPDSPFGTRASEERTFPVTSMASAGLVF